MKIRDDINFTQLGEDFKFKQVHESDIYKFVKNMNSKNSQL